MKPKSARNKGKRGEREVAELLTKLSGVKYRRVPMSGALHQDFPFDLMAMGKEQNKFSGIGNEVKNTANLKTPEWIKQIETACEDAGYLEFSAKWFIAFRHKGKWYFLLNQNYFEHLNK